MKKTLLLVALLMTCSGLSLAATADKISYPSFSIGSERYVFSDFQTANYVITYNAQTKKTTYSATINLQVKESGHVVFDVVVDPSSAKLDGKDILVPQITAPDNKTKFRATSVTAESGSHELKIEGDITRLVSYEDDGVSSAFWLNDLYDRSFLENYLPSSFEYDRVKMKFVIEILNSTQEHTVVTNGTVTSASKNSFVVNYPNYYNTASIFFHMLPKNNIRREDFTLKSIDGRTLPAMIYYPIGKGKSLTSDGAETLKDYRAVVEKKFANLESDFGKFLHEQIIVYATSGGGFPGIAGMEYCGATMTSLDALTHELTHSYFGRGIVPSNGNAGWLDEAITTWGDSTNYRENSSGTILDPSSMFKQSSHTRFTHRGAYSTGANFMSQVAGKMKEMSQKPFVDFLEHLISNKAFTPYTNDDFWAWSKEYYGFSLLDLIPKMAPELKAASPYLHTPDTNHRRFSDAELQKLL